MPEFKASWKNRFGKLGTHITINAPTKQEAEKLARQKIQTLDEKGELILVAEMKLDRGGQNNA